MNFFKKERWNALWISAIIALVVTLYISFILVAMNAGFSSQFLLIWFRSWAVAFLLAFPSLLYVGPFIRCLLLKLVASRC